MGYNLRLHKEDYFQHQWDFLTSKKPINGLIAGYGSGKTHVFLHKTFVNHISKRNNKGVSNGWVVYPTYDLADELFVEPFKDLLTSKGIPFDYNIFIEGKTVNLLAIVVSSLWGEMYRPSWF